MSDPKYYVVHRADENNVGDMSSNPLRYFYDSQDYEVIDIVDIGKKNYNSSVPMIVGGGGLINNDFFGDVLHNVLMSADYNQLMTLWRNRWQLCDPENAELQQEFLKEYQVLIKKYVDRLKNESAPRILWGAGHNGEIGKKKNIKLEYPDWISEFDHVGIRDWNQNLPWVPCASCMHGALTKKYSIKNDIIWFEHKKQLIKDFGNDSIPRFVNSGNNIDQTIELLGSANIILTNSYHGAYWGTLMGKRVIVVSPWSTKFSNMRHQPTIILDSKEWKDVIDTVDTHYDALDECVAATEKFWKEIRGV